MIELLNERMDRIERNQWPTPLRLPSQWITDNTGYIDPNACPMGGQHQYPFPWGAITPPNCKKCGKAADTYTVTCQGGV